MPATLLAGQALAQPVTTLEDVVVTARRSEESGQAVPVAVSVVTGKVLAQRSVINLDDVAKSAPSLTFNAGARGGETPLFGIRGVGSSDFTGAFDTAVGVYINDMVVGRPAGILSSLYDLQSVQVLRGPQGTLFGRNTTGGAILITSREPSDHFGGYVNLSYGNFNYGNAEAALNLPFNDKIRLRLATRVAKRDGYVKSVVTGQDQSDLNSKAFRATLALQPADKLRSLTYFEWSKSDTNATGTSSFGLLPVGAVSGTTAVNANNNIADAGNRALVAAAGAVSRANYYRNTTEEIQFSHIQTWNIINTTTYELSENISFKNIISGRKLKESHWTDIDASAARILPVGGYDAMRQISEEFQVISKFDRFDSILGVYYFREHGLDGQPSFTAVPLAQHDAPAAQGQTATDVDTRSFSIFGEGHFALTDKLKVNLGGRWTRDYRGITLKSHNILNPFSANPVLSCNVGATISQSTLPDGTLVINTAPANPCAVKRDPLIFKQWTWMASVNYQLSDDMMLYLAHRKGYHSGAWNARATFLVPRDYADPEQIYDVEAGLKSDFRISGAPARLNVAVYWGRFKNLQRGLGLPPVILNGVTRLPASIGNAAGAKLYGLETEFTVKPTSNLELSGFYNYNYIAYTKWLDPQPNGTVIDRSSYPLQGAPRHNGGATIRYTLPTHSSLGDWVLQANGYFASSRGAATPINPTIKGYNELKPYQLANFRVELDNAFGSPATLAVWVNNAFNEKYSTGQGSIVSIGFASDYPGPPRMYGVSVNVPFGGER